MSYQLIAVTQLSGALQSSTIDPHLTCEGADVWVFWGFLGFFFKKENILRVNLQLYRNSDKASLYSNKCSVL